MKVDMAACLSICISRGLAWADFAKYSACSLELHNYYSKNITVSGCHPKCVNLLLMTTLHTLYFALLVAMVSLLQCCCFFFPLFHAAYRYASTWTLEVQLWDGETYTCGSSVDDEKSVHGFHYFAVIKILMFFLQRTALRCVEKLSSG